MPVATVNLDLHATDAVGAIRTLAEGLAGTEGVADWQKLVADILEREAVLSTYLGHGLAMPHARTNAVTRRVVNVGRCREGVPFGHNGDRAQFVVLVGCPKPDVKAYLEFTKSLLNRLRDTQVRAQLMAATEPAEFLGLLGLNPAAAPAGRAAP